MRAIAVMVLLLLCVLAAPRVAAQTCSVDAPDVSFGNVQVPLPATIPSNGSVTVTCSGSRNQRVDLCLGIDRSNAGRQMSRGPNQVPYEIYTNSSHTQVWVDGTDMMPVAFNIGPTGIGTHTLIRYMQMTPPPGPNPPGGLYNTSVPDTVVLRRPGLFGFGCSLSFLQQPLATDTFNTSVIIDGSCTITTELLLDFGSVMGSSTSQVDSALDLHVICNDQLPYTIALNGGVVGSTIANRRLGLNGTPPGAVDYQLYHNAGRSQLWGDGTVGTVHNATGNGMQQDITVYGRVPAQPLPGSGTYKDTVTATITF